MLKPDSPQEGHLEGLYPKFLLFKTLPGKIIISILILLLYQFILNPAEGLQELYKIIDHLPEDGSPKQAVWAINTFYILNTAICVGICIFLLSFAFLQLNKLLLRLNISISEKFLNGILFYSLQTFIMIQSGFLSSLWLEWVYQNFSFYLKSPDIPLLIQILALLPLQLPCIFPWLVAGRLFRILDDSFSCTRVRKESPTVKSVKASRINLPASLETDNLPDTKTVLQEFSILHLFDRILSNAFILLPIIYTLANQHLLDPYGDVALICISQFLIIGLSLTIVIFILVKHLEIRQVMMNFNHKLLLLFVVINFYKFSLSKEGFDARFLDHFIVIYALIFVGNILVAFKNIFLITKEKEPRQAHYGFLVGSMLSLSLVLFAKSINLSLIAHINMTMFYPILQNYESIYKVLIGIVTITIPLLSFRNYPLSKKDSINILILLIILSSGFIYLLTVKPIISTDYIAGLCLIALGIVAFLNFRNYTLRQLFIMRVFYEFLLFGAILFLFNVLSLEKLQQLSFQTILGDMRAAIVGIFIASIWSKFQNFYEKAGS